MFKTEPDNNLLRREKKKEDNFVSCIKELRFESGKWVVRVGCVKIDGRNTMQRRAGSIEHNYVVARRNCPLMMGPKVILRCYKRDFVTTRILCVPSVSERE